MESLSGPGQAGIGIRDCTLPDRVSHLVSALESASLAALAGVGTTGDMIGIATVSSTTTTPISPTAESLLITTPSITPAGTSITVEDFKAGVRLEVRRSMDQHRSTDSQRRNMDPWRRMSSLVVIPARSGALITGVSLEDSRLAGSRASVEVSTEEAVSMVAEVEAFTVAEAAGNLGFIH